MSIRAKPLILFFSGILAVAGVALTLAWAEKDRILFPPEITCEPIAAEEEFSCTLLVKKANAGVYSSACQYVLDKEGHVLPADSRYWQSYADTISHDRYKHFRRLCDKPLTQAITQEEGFLLIFQEDNRAPTTIIETGAEDEVLFTWTFPAGTYTSPCQTVCTDGDFLYILSYTQDTDQLAVTTVDKVTGQERTVSLSYSDLSGDIQGQKRMGGFIFSGADICVIDDVLYFAQTHYSSASEAVMAAYDLASGQALYYREIDEAQVVQAKWDEAARRCMVLLNRKEYTPLSLLSWDLTASSAEELSAFALPEEFTVQQVSGDYYLFCSDMNTQLAAILLDASSSDGMRHSLLAVYDCATGDNVYLSRLSMDADYEIYAISLP